ncbi:transmembrane protein 45B-like [Saccoglossus kowalevskii]|uniref:Transmembrane protein 45B-like n=1 Tax=Saccoglossus kowalevskii TaxID=10224 RepID=A0ABM0M620_SACKO|nr:PREDICTED: transmembrane protein 45B-like [Saccoglossus kowalevskii]
MGLFMGHALPGSFFIVFGVWWCIKYSYRFIRKNSNVFRQTNNPTVNSNGTRRFFTSRDAEFIEGIIVVVFGSVGVIVEQSWPEWKWTMLDKDTGKFVHSVEWQHCTMYIFFGIAGAVFVIARTCVTGLKAFEHFFMALAFFIEGMLFYFHVHARSPLDISLHYMLVITVLLTALVTFTEIWKTDVQLLPFIRTGLTFTQGTWFWQVAFVLYPPNGGAHWDPDSHENLMFVTMAFCWHILACMAVMAGIFGVISVYFRMTITQASTNEIRLECYDKLIDEI